jgi:formylglycine-generating enzyme
VRAFVWALWVLGATAACSKKSAPEKVEPSTVVEGASRPPWDGGARTPAPPKGMVWIPPGALVAGTQPGRLPRIADEEMSGEQVILSGYFISIFPYPNEEAAIPIANVTRDEAQALCEAEGKRLCTELEWERACKGPQNRVYEYGDSYRPQVCGTGVEPRMLPSGLRVGCVSDFGVRDMHGSLWEWTSSPWGRGQRGEYATVRGGNAVAGELVGRCANASGRSPSQKSAVVGFRCCSGPKNDVEVTISVEQKKRLQLADSGDHHLLGRLSEATRSATFEGAGTLKAFRATRLWYWRPIGNEELVVGGGCSGLGSGRQCGVVVVRLGQGEPDLLAFAGSGRYVPTLRTGPGRRDLWVYGGDERSHYRRPIEYRWGRVATGEAERNVKDR